MVTTHECCLCSQIEGRVDGDLIARLLPDKPYARRVMLETTSFAVIPSLGPLVAGHSLLCPKRHVRSFGALDSRLSAELEGIKAELRRGLREMVSSEITVFEHGMATTGDRIVCTVDHAHLHFVPLPASLGAGLMPPGQWVEFDGSQAALRQLSGGREYVAYEAPTGRSRLFSRPT